MWIVRIVPKLAVSAKQQPQGFLENVFLYGRTILGPLSSSYLPSQNGPEGRFLTVAVRNEVFTCQQAFLNHARKRVLGAHRAFCEGKIARVVRARKWQVGDVGDLPHQCRSSIL
jgi:hypothetical protein